VSDTIKPEPAVDRCVRCAQILPLTPALPEWGDVPSPLCAQDWQLFADARARGGWVDMQDAFDNASDEQFAAVLFPPKEATGG
jgi:hypothetical protein